MAEPASMRVSTRTCATAHLATWARIVRRVRSMLCSALFLHLRDESENGLALFSREERERLALVFEGGESFRLLAHETLPCARHAVCLHSLTTAQFCKEHKQQFCKEHNHQRSAVAARNSARASLICTSQRRQLQWRTLAFFVVYLVKLHPLSHC